MLSKIKYIILTAQRDLLFIGLAIAIAAVCSMGFFLGSNAVTEDLQTSLVYAAGGARIVLVLGLVIFTSFSIRRFFENREIELMLVRPVSRSQFIFAFIIGFFLICFAFTIFTGCLLFLFTKPDFVGFLAWFLSILLEGLIVVSLALTASLILRSAVSAVLLTLGFYALSRISGFILMIVTKPGPESMLNKSYLAVSSLVPRLDFFGKTEWLVYGVKNIQDVYLFLIQAAIYVSLLLAVAIFDFKRKEF